MEKRGGKRKGAGRPLGTSNEVTQKAILFRKYLLERIIKEKGLIISALLAKAKKGDVNAIRELFDRGFGKSKEMVEISGGDGEPIKITVDMGKLLEKVYGKK